MRQRWKVAVGKGMTRGVRRLEHTLDALMPAIPLPSEDSFYRAGERVVSDASPGTILASRPVNVHNLRRPARAQAGQIRYCSTGSHGEPIGAVTTLLLPRTPWSHGRRPLLSYQCAIDSLSQRRDPSYTLRQGTQKEFPLMALALRRGWAVVTTDYTGPNHAYGVGPIAAHTVLDGIRAALTLEEAGLGPSTPVGLWGYSGGGHASAFTGEQHPTYAPDINLVAVAAGGVPGDLLELAGAIDGSAFAGLLLGCVIGISREFPEIGIESIFTDDGHRAWVDLADGTVEEITAYFPFRHLAELTIDPNPFALPIAEAAFAPNRLGQAFPTASTYIYHSIFDQLLPIRGLDRLVDTYRRGGVDVRYRRGWLGEHVVYAALGAFGAVRFLAGRFDRAEVASRVAVRADRSPVLEPSA
jgi:hypothetical protein